MDDDNPAGGANDGQQDFIKRKAAPVLGIVFRSWLSSASNAIG